ncbi:MAG: hypothetical protein Q7T05_07030 [Dehalococcoidia bacterium]|nr:hypothetical protein [Dehalococcoidia bacterium]
MINAINQLFTDECYELVPAQPISSSTPDFHAMLQGEKRAYEVVGALRMSPDEVLPGYNKLVEMEKVLGDIGGVRPSRPSDAGTPSLRHT